MNDDGEVGALRSLVDGQPAVDHPTAFRWHASSKRIDQVDVYFLFEWQWFCL